MVNEDGVEELLLADVDVIEPEDGSKIRLVSIYGEQKVLEAKIKSMSLVNHRVVLAQP
jgi:predicted RNA-binding protein